MLSERQLAEVTGIVRRVAHEVVVDRFGRLTEADVTEKSPGELVTVADREAEQQLSAALRALLPGSQVVGEEAASLDPDSQQALAGDAPVWIIDPIDGTEAFASGSPRFATLVALAHRGRLLASWTYAPLLELTATAVAGAGAYVNGRRVQVATDQPADGIRELDVALPQPRWWTAEHRSQFNSLFTAGISPTFFDTSGLTYIELARGRRAAMVVTWELAWDHAAGLLLHAEAGGHTMTATGKPFDLAGGNALPVVVGPSPAIGQAVLASLLAGQRG